MRNVNQVPGLIEKWIPRGEIMKKSHDMKYVLIFLAFLFLVTPVQARHNSEHPLSAEDWKEVMDKVVLLEPSGLMPTLLPTIMINQDTLKLTDEQINAFRAWRKKNYTNMVNIMNEVIEKMVQFRVESLSPRITSDRLLAFQSEIQELQRQVLEIKLSCRKLVMTSFTDEQWENFAFVVSDNPKLASLVSRETSINPESRHNGLQPIRASNIIPLVGKPAH